MGMKEIVIGTFAWVIVFILLSIPLLVLILWKCCVILCAKFFRKDLTLPYAMDAMNCLGDGENKSVVNFGLVCRVGGELNLEGLQQRFSEMFLGYENNSSETRRQFSFDRLHCTLVTFGGFVFFKRIDQIDINNHICMKHLKEDQCLEDLLSTWILSKYRNSSPFWEIIVVPLRATNETAVAIKLHHAIADGYSLLYILDQLTENASSPYLVKDFNQSLGQKVGEMLSLPCFLGKMAGDAEMNPFTCTKESPYRWMIAFTRLDLNILKEIRRKQNVSFGPIVLSLIGGALKRYLLETKTETELPKFLIMSATLPWPGHPAKNSQTLKNEKLCNHWTVGMVKVPIGKDLDPVQRLVEVSKSLTEFQDVGLHKFMKRIMAPLLWTFPVCILQKMLGSDPGFVAGYSSTVGGDDYKLMGKPVTSIHHLLAIHDVNPFIPISIFTFSHENHLDLTVSVNPQHFLDRTTLDRILNQYLPHELNRLSFLSGIIQTE